MKKISLLFIIVVLAGFQVHAQVNYQNTTTNNTNSSAIGIGTVASGGASFACGITSTASGAGSTTMGIDNLAIGHYSMTFGSDLKAAQGHSIVIGRRFCQHHETGKQPNLFAYDRLFESISHFICRHFTDLQ